MKNVGDTIFGAVDKYIQGYLVAQRWALIPDFRKTGVSFHNFERATMSPRLFTYYIEI